MDSTTLDDAAVTRMDIFLEGIGRTLKDKRQGSAMECASHFDVMRVDELIDAELYAQANELLERIVAMLTKLIDA
jgi:hypothetical protein